VCGWSKLISAEFYSVTVVLRAVFVHHCQGDYVPRSEEEVDRQREEYDVILGLRITKWIHLNHGDVGLRQTFRRMYKQLRPGGSLLLEMQPWKSYRKKKKLTVCFCSEIRT